MKNRLLLFALLISLTTVGCKIKRHEKVRVFHMADGTKAFQQDNDWFWSSDSSSTRWVKDDTRTPSTSKIKVEEYEENPNEVEADETTTDVGAEDSDAGGDGGGDGSD